MDPVIERLDDALARVSEMERRAQQGESIPNAQIVTEMRSIRDDLLAERRDVIERRERIDAQMAMFLPRQPYQRIGGFIVAIMGTVAGGWVLWLLTN